MCRRISDVFPTPATGGGMKTGARLSMHSSGVEKPAPWLVATPGCPAIMIVNVLQSSTGVAAAPPIGRAMAGDNASSVNRVATLRRATSTGALACVRHHRRHSKAIPLAKSTSTRTQPSAQASDSMQSSGHSPAVKAVLVTSDLPLQPRSAR